MSNASSQAPTPPRETLEQFAESKQKSHRERHEQDWRVEPSQALNEARNEVNGPTPGNPEHDEQWHQQDEQVISSPAVNGGLPLPQRGTRSSGSVSRLALPASMGRVSTLGRGASCGAVTGAPIRKRVIAVDFQPTHPSVEPRGSVSARFTPCRPKAINPGFPRAANMGGVRPTSRARSQWDVA